MQKFTYRRLALAAVTALAGLQAMPAAAQSEPLIGQIACAGFDFAPDGWLALNGQLLSISSYQTLFSLLGTRYGGDGVATFGLPDMRGRTLIHQGIGTGLTSRTMGQSGGQENTTLAVTNLPPHSHTFAPLGSSNDATSQSPSGKVAANKSRTTLYAEPTNTVPMQAGTTGSTGSATAISNMQPYVTVNCFIAVEGLYPTRP